MDFCYGRVMRGAKTYVSSDVAKVFARINEERFENLFSIAYDEKFEEWSFVGANWFDWLRFSIIFHRNKIKWPHNDDIVVTEWVLFTFCHKAIRILDPRAQYREVGDDYLSEVNFDTLFPTLDLWINQLEESCGVSAADELQRARNSTPDCFWKI